MAIDGNTDGIFRNGSVFHSDNVDDPWWQVALEETDLASGSNGLYDINRIMLHNRTDACCQERLSDIHVFVSANDMSGQTLIELLADDTVWKTEIEGPVGDNIDIPVGENGRYVKVQLAGEDRSLTLAEVQVFGYPVQDGSSVMHISRASAHDYTIESTGEQVIYLVRRFGDLSAASYPFSASMVDTLSLNSDPFLAEMMGPSGFAMQSAPSMASTDDFVLKNENGIVLINSLPFEAGQDTAQFIIEAINDDLIEVPEYVSVEFAPQDNLEIRYANQIQAVLNDNTPGINDDSLLFVGTFVPENGAVTSAYGVVTVRLSGDNSYGEVSLSFSGLTTLQTAAHIHIANPDSGPVAFSLPMGQFEGERWDIKAAEHLVTDQAMLDALLGGGLYANVHSGKYPAGEIKAWLYQRTGSETAEFNYPTPEYEVLTGEALTQDIHRFLTQATFGAKPEMVAEMESRIAAKGGDRIAAYNEWIDEQLLLDSPSHIEYNKAGLISYYQDEELPSRIFIHNAVYGLISDGWYTSAIYAKAHLRERTAFALSEILVAGPTTGVTGTDFYPMLAGYNDLLKENAFGSFSELLYDVSRHPAMGRWLSHFQNQKTTYDFEGNLMTSPDENYAREIMQLFSIGLLELHPDGTLKLNQSGLPLEAYTPNDVSELSRVFTGWAKGVTATDSHDKNYGNSINTNFNSGFSYARFALNTSDQWSPMINFPIYHDDESKEILGFLFEAGVDADEELRHITNILSTHSNSGPFLARRMIERMTLSNPSAGYLYRTAVAFENSERKMGEMVRAILLDPEVRNPSLADGIGYGRVKEPLLQVVSVCRFLDCQVREDLADRFSISDLITYGLPAGEVDLYETNAERVLISFSSDFRQAPLNPPSVFNWFDPFYSPPGELGDAGIVAPELSHLSPPVTVGYYNYIDRLVFTPSRIGVTRIDTSGASGSLAYTQPAMMKDAYMSVMDTNSNGAIDDGDTSFGDEAKIKEAIEAMVDVADLYLCQGWLKGMDNDEDEIREIILGGIYDMYKSEDNSSSNNANNARDDRIEEALLVMLTAPRCMIQK